MAWRGPLKPGRAFSSAAEHPAGHLPVKCADLRPVALRGGTVRRVLGDLSENGRLAKRLGHVHVVPIDHVLDPNAPCGGASFAQVQQPRLSRAVVEPENAVKLIAAAHGRPIADEELRFGHGREIVEILRHQVDHAVVARTVIIGLQAERA